MARFEFGLPLVLFAALSVSSQNPPQSDQHRLASSAQITQRQPAKVPMATISKDPAAMALAQNSLARMNVAPGAYQDSVASGTITYQWEKPVTIPILIKTKGTQSTRVELTRPEGISVRIVNHGVGVIRRADGTVQKLFMNNTIVERVNHIPALSLLADVQDPSVSVEDLGTTSLNGQAVNMVALRSLPVPNTPKWVWDIATTKTTFFIDSASGMVLKIAYTRFGENSGNSGDQIEELLSTYQLIDGMMVPLSVTTYDEGKLESSLSISTISFNVGLSDSEFAIP